MTVNTESEVYDAIAEKDIYQHRQLELFVDVNSKRSCVNQHEEPAATATSDKSSTCTASTPCYSHTSSISEIYTAGSGEWGQTSQAPTAYEIKLNS